MNRLAPAMAAAAAAAHPSSVAMIAWKIRMHDDVYVSSGTYKLLYISVHLIDRSVAESTSLYAPKMPWHNRRYHISLRGA